MGTRRFAVDHQAVERDLGRFSHPKEFVVDRVAPGETAGDLPKNCHLLPFWSRKTATPVATKSYLLSFSTTLRIPETVGVPDLVCPHAGYCEGWRCRLACAGRVPLIILSHLRDVGRAFSARRQTGMADLLLSCRTEYAGSSIAAKFSGPGTFH
jgi:hypothetical protein